MMKRWRRTYFFLFAPGVAVLICAALWQFHSHSRAEPVYDGKRLSVWLDELCALDYDKRTSLTTAPALALRAIGTNAIPWLLSEMRRSRNQIATEVNSVLRRQRLTNFRLPDGTEPWERAALGFWALGPLAEPAIPDLMTLLEERPNEVTLALAGMGTPALPALQQCLTNTRAYKFPNGLVAIIPGETIGCIYNAVSAGRISKTEAAIFLPAVRAWAQSTNKHAAAYATQYLTDWHFQVSAEDGSRELSKGGK
jgi:hypothetical protein